VVVPLGLDGEEPGVEVDPLGVVVDGGGVEGVVDGDVADGGDADGVRSSERSPTRSVRDSLQAVNIPRLSATAPRPVSILFIGEPPPCGLRNQGERVQRTCRRSAS
jgi:hypothetical protein